MHLSELSKTSLNERWVFYRNHQQICFRQYFRRNLTTTATYLNFLTATKSLPHLTLSNQVTDHIKRERVLKVPEKIFAQIS